VYIPKVNDTVKYLDPVSLESKVGKILSVDSERYDKLEYTNNGYNYWSKKTSSWRPVKDYSSVYWEVASNEKVFSEFILLEDINGTV